MKPDFEFQRNQSGYYIMLSILHFFNGQFISSKHSPSYNHCFLSTVHHGTMPTDIHLPSCLDLKTSISTKSCSIQCPHSEPTSFLVNFTTLLLILVMMPSALFPDNPVYTWKAELLVFAKANRMGSA